MLTKNDLSQIRTAVQKAIQPEIKALDIEIKSLKKNMATKDDLKGMATKDDLKGMATKDDLKKLETRLDGKMENLEKRLIGRIDDAQMEIIEVVEKHKADKIKVNNLEQRVDRLEDNAGLPPFPTQ